ncbi:MAG: Sensor histidine kinase MtrB, partial [Frankiales bacterium]|nr:Sensor histidine kinase MtrB [Frankiales bacterium]
MQDVAQAASQRWRTSLLTRVVVSTLVVSGVVVVLFTSLLLESFGRGLVQAKTRASLAEARSGVVLLEAAVNGVDPENRALQEVVLQETVKQLDARGAVGDAYSVVALGPPQASRVVSLGADVDDVPAELERRLLGTTGPEYAFADVPVVGGRDRGLVIGSVLSVPSLGADYRVFHLFPLTSEQQTFGQTRRTAAVAGLLLVAMLALITGLVGRQVVAPVRLAARTAERFAGGRLDERLRVRGEDELARLGTAFNKMATALQTQIRQLEDLSRVQRRFVSDVSHELRTPLTTVRMAADVLYDARQDFPASPERAAELLQAELDRFENLLAALLEISRFDAGAAELDASPVDLGPLVRRVAAAAQPLADRKGSRLDLRLPSRPVVAELEAVRIERVLRNLVVNAIEHGEGGPVEVVMSDDDEAVVVTVRDHGVGLQPGQAGMVFTRFWRGDPSRARTTGGTGLGLAIALEDVRLHGGWLQAAGTPGVGSVFRMTLPRKAGRSPVDTPLAPPSASSSRRAP